MFPFLAAFNLIIHVWCVHMGAFYSTKNIRLKIMSYLIILKKLLYKCFSFKI